MQGDAMTDIHAPLLTPVPEPISDPSPRRRIGGLDLARALAMAGMLLTHYVFLDSDSWVRTARHMLDGRAMPLFMVLGGVGATLLVQRRPNPDRNLLIRAAIVMVIGLALNELDSGIVIILPAYALLFALTTLFRRLRTTHLVVLAVVIGVAGSWTQQAMASSLMELQYDDLTDVPVTFWTLFFAGGYPFFPAASFFLLGMVLGRLPLDVPRVAASIAGAGAVALAVPLLVVRGVERWTDVEVPDVPAGLFMGKVQVPFFEPDRFEWNDVLSTAGHSQMLGWVISAMGSACLVIGLSLLLADRFGRATAPLETVGRMALTFYVAQVIPSHWYLPFTRSPWDQFEIALGIWFGFMAFALVWNRFFGAGPLERLLRLGSGKPTAAAPAPATGGWSSPERVS